MTLTVSVSELRSNLARYLEKVANGANLLVRDEKKDQLIAELVGKKGFDPNSFEKALQSAAGIFTAENHPEWNTKSKVIKWVTKNRLSDERSF